MMKALLLVEACLLAIALAQPSKPFYFTQFVDHFTSDTRTYKQRYYVEDKHFGGPGSPIFMILGGEGGVPPEVGIFYPWVSGVFAKTHRALVVEPEHRFYGESLPFGNESFSRENLRLLSSQQALADAAHFVRWQQRQRNCTARGTAGYCPVLTIGGSYPGFLSAMMRIRYPAVVDMAYAASAPMKFYLQETGQYDYYARVTSSAEKSLPGCASAVRGAFEQLETFLGNTTLQKVAKAFAICGAGDSHANNKDLRDNIFFLLEQTFANLNMANYPPDNSTALHRTCRDLAAAAAKGGEEPLLALKRLLLTYTHSASTRRLSFLGSELRLQPAAESQECFDLEAHIPAGHQATARCGDWSGCGSGRDGEMWDYQTCTFEVERIGFGTHEQMFPERPWTREWLAEHCMRRFGVTPQPLALRELWGFDPAGLAATASRILFTNGLNDGWSVGGFAEDIAPAKGVVSINLLEGAHHSDLGHTPEETPEVRAVHKRVDELVLAWLKEVRAEAKSRGEAANTLVV